MATEERAPASVEVPTEGAASSPVAPLAPAPPAIDGVVVDPYGRAVAGATIDWYDRTNGENHGDATRTEAGGGFRLERLTPGWVGVRARCEPFARSKELVFKLAPTEVKTELRLELRHGGRLSCEVLALDGTPAREHEVQLSLMESESTRIKTDESGRFELDALVPGTVWISVYFEDEKGEFAGGDRKEVTILAGQTTYAVLGGPQEVRVVVHGRVVSSGLGVGDLELYASSADSKDTGVHTRTDADGRFEMELEHAGRTRFGILTEEGANWSFWRDLPQSGELAVELELPSGGMRGRLFADDPPGRWQGIQVMIRPSHDWKFGSWTSRDAHVNEDGTWSCSSLDPGLYDVIAGTNLDRDSSRQDLAADPRNGIEVRQGEIVEGIDLRLTAGGSIRGRITGPEGAFLHSPGIQVLDDSGRALRVEHWIDDDDGYSISSLPPGSVWLIGWTLTGYVTPVPVRAEVRPGEVTDLDLRLVSGSELRMRPEDGEWPRDLRLCVRDSAGWPYSVQQSWNAVISPQAEASLLLELVAGPLPPGTYTIELGAPGKEGRAVLVNVPGETEVVLDLEDFR